MAETLKQLYQPLDEILEKFPCEEEVEKLVNDLENKTTETHYAVETYLKRLETVEKTVDEEFVKNNDRLAELNQTIKKYRTRSEQLHRRQENLQGELNTMSAIRDHQNELTKALSVQLDKLVLRERILNDN